VKSIYFLIVITILFNVSCKSNNNNIKIEDNNDIFADKTVVNRNSRKVMYVISINGLDEKVYPSVDSQTLRTFLYCERIIVYDKSKETVTIDGITNFWYKIVCNTSYTDDSWMYSYVFGGYLSEQLPKDAPITILNGYWMGDPLLNENMSYLFSGNTFILWQWHGELESKGTFSIIDDKILFNPHSYIAYHFGKGWQNINANIQKIHTFDLLDKKLKISKSSIEANDYNPSECYIFMKQAEK